MGIVRHLAIGATALALVGATPALAAVNLIQNGGFETNGGNGQIAFNTTAADWSVPALNGSYFFLFNAGGAGASGSTADNGGSIGQYGTVSIYGPGNGSANGLTLSPDGGAFVASDPEFQNGAITQSLTGLSTGHTYAVSFWWAAGQQFNHSGSTSAGWEVGLGSDPTQSTGNASIGSRGFSGWTQSTFNFVAQGSTETLSFLATGTGSAALPPFALLDGVSVMSTGVPEPSTWAMMLLGFAGLGYAGFRGRRRTAISIV